MRIVSPLVCVLLVGPALSAGLSAQSSVWSWEGEIGASVFFGDRGQTTITTGAGTERSDSLFEFSAEAEFTYGEATDEEGRSFVAKRSWSFEADFNWRPHGRLSPFVFGEVQSSLERRIDLRYDTGVGGQLRIQRGSAGRADLSLSVLAEETTRSNVDDDASGIKTRVSARLRARREMSDDRIAINAESQYEPVFNEFDDFVVKSKSSVAFDVTDVFTLKVTFVDTYDSRAIRRGARTNNSGHLFFGVLSSF